GTDVELDWIGCVHERIARQAASAPERCALAYADRQLTYGEMIDRVHRLARHLRGLGVGPGTVVAVLHERGPDLVVALLAVLEAGGAYLPLDPRHPAARLAFSIRDSRAMLLLTHAAWADKPGEVGVRVLCLDRAWPE